jgi:hypothetical protein
MQQLRESLRDPRRLPAFVAERVRQWAQRDASDLEPELCRRTEARRAIVESELAKRGEEESASLRRLLEDQRRRILEQQRKADDPQLSLMLPDIKEERDQFRIDRSRHARRLIELKTEVEQAPARVRDGYRVRASRLEPVGLVYLWPATN